MSDRNVPPAVTRLVTELEGIFRDRLRAVAIYGEAIHLTGLGGHDDRQIHTLVVVDALPASDLRACAGLADAWQQRGLAVPLLLTTAELARSLDAFPLEFDHILADHVTVHGSDPFALLSVARDDVRRACEGQARSHALHLRESFLQACAEPKLLARIIAASARPFHALLASVARLHGERGTFDAEALARVAARADLDLNTLRQVLEASRGGTITAADAEPLFPMYLDAAERLVRHVDAWRA